MINSLNSEARLQGKNIRLSLFQFTSFRNVTALDLNFEYRFCKRKMKLNQQWNLQKMFSSVHDVHLCTWLIRPTPLKREMSKDQLGFMVWMTACSLRLSFTSSIASGLAPRSSAVRQTRALSFQQSFHFFFFWWIIFKFACNPVIFRIFSSRGSLASFAPSIAFFLTCHRTMMSKTFVVARQVLVPRWCFCWCGWLWFPFHGWLNSAAIGALPYFYLKTRGIIKQPEVILLVVEDMLCFWVIQTIQIPIC